MALALGALSLGLLLGGAVQEAHAQSVVTLVNNTGETLGANNSNLHSATSFTTGANSAGYTLSSVDLYVHRGSATTVRIRANNASNRPGDIVATLTAPDSIVPGSNNRFTAPADTVLAANTTYWVEINSTSAKVNFQQIASDDETGEDDWSIGDVAIFWLGSRWLTFSNGNSLGFAINGIVRAAADPVVTITAGSAVTEGTAATYTVTADPAPAANLPVTLTVADAPAPSDFVASTHEGTGKTVVILADATSATYTVPTVGMVGDDPETTDEPNGPVTVTVNAGMGYTVGSTASAAVTVIDDDATRVTLAQSGTTTLPERGGARVFTVSLGRRLYLGETVTVPLTVTGTNVTAADYTLTLGTTSASPNRGVTLDLTTPHSAAQPAVVFTGHGTNVVRVARLALRATADTTDEGTSETLTVGFGTGPRAVRSTLDRAMGTGPGGTTPTGTVAFEILEPIPISLELSPTRILAADLTGATITLTPKNVSFLFPGDGSGGGRAVSRALVNAADLTNGAPDPAAEIRFSAQGLAGLTLTGAPTGLTIASGKLLPRQTDVHGVDGHRSAELTLAYTGAVITAPDTVTVTVADHLLRGRADTAEILAADDIAADFTIDPAGVEVSESSLALTEGHDMDADKTYEVKLNTDPGAGVTVTVAARSDDEGAATVSPASRDFTGGGSGNWGTAQVFTVTAAEDGDTNDETLEIAHTVTASGSTAPYHNISADPVDVTVTDAGHGVIVSTDAVAVEDNDDTDTYTLRLKSAPATGETVMVEPSSSAAAVATVSAAVSFTDADWNTAKTVTVTGKGAGTATVSHRIVTARTGYPVSLVIPTVAVTVTAAADTTPPVLERINVTQIIALIYNEALDTASTPAAGDFTVTVGGNETTVAQVQVQGTLVGLVMPLTPAPDAAVVITYTPGTNPIQDLAGNDAPAISSLLVDRTAPVLVSATVDGTALTLTYDEPLDEASVPPPSRFTVLVDSAEAMVDATAVSGRTVALTLASAVTSGQTVTVSYTATADNSIRDINRNTAPSLSAQPVRVLTDAPPMLLTITTLATLVVLVYDETLDTTSVPAGGDFMVTVGGTPVTVQSVTVNGAQVELALPSAPGTAALTVSYTPGTTPIRDLDGNEAAAFTGEMRDTTPPVLLAAVVSGTVLTLTYSEQLYPIDSLRTSDFTVMAGRAEVTVSAGEISGRQVILTLAAAAPGGQAVTVSYQPASVADTQIQDLATNRVAAFTDQPVARGTAGQPVVTVTAGPGVTEGSPAVFTLTASPAPGTGSTLSVMVTVADAAGADFLASGAEGAQTVTIPASGTFTYSVATDNSGTDVDEPSGEVTVTVADGSGYNPGLAASAAVPVTDDDPTTVTLTLFASGNVLEGGTKLHQVRLGRRLVAGETLTVPLTFAAGSGTATFGTDYTLLCIDRQGQACTGFDRASTAQVEFTGPSAEVIGIIVRATSDNVDEPAGESFDMGLGTVTHTGLDGGVRTTDSAPAFDILDPGVITVSPTALTVVEGSGEPAGYTVVLGADPGAEVTVTASSDITAAELRTGGGSWGASVILTFTAGNSGNWATAQTVEVRAASSISADATATVTHLAVVASDSNNRFHNTPVEAVSVSVKDAGGLAQVQFSTAGQSVNENDGTATVTVTKTGSAAAQVRWRTADSTAEAPGDYTTASGTLTWAANNTTAQTITVTLIDDTDDEQSESFWVELSQVSAAPVVIGSQWRTAVTILDNDQGGEITVSPTALTVVEGSREETGYTVVLGSDPGATVRVTATSGNTAAQVKTSGNWGATATLDFTGGDSGNWATAQTVLVRGTPNDGNTADETVTIEHAAAVASDNSSPFHNADIEDVTVSVRDSGGLATVQFQTLSIIYQEDESPASITVTKTGSAAAAVMWRTVDGSAEAPGDYTAASGTLTWAAGDTTAQTIEVDLEDDDLFEDSENFQVVLSQVAATPTVIGANWRHVATIINTTPGGVLTVSGFGFGDAASGDEGTRVEFEVSLSPGATRDGTLIPIDIYSGDSAGEAGGADASVPTDIVFALGATAASATIPLLADHLAEGDETLVVGVDIDSLPAGYTMATGDTGRDSILISDVPNARLRAPPAGAVAEGATKVLTAELTRAAGAGGVTVPVVRTQGTATADDVSLPEIIIAEGATSGTGTFSALDDDLYEGGETVRVKAGTVTGHTSQGGAYDIAITDTDAAPTAITLSVSPTTVAEDAGLTAITVTAEVDGDVSWQAEQTVSVSVAGSGGASVVGFAAVPDVDLTIPAGMGEGTASFDLTPTEDTTETSDETVTVSGTHTSATVASATLTIEDDDGTGTNPTVELSVSGGGEVTEGGMLTVTATRSAANASGVALAIPLAVKTTGTTAQASDYTVPLSIAIANTESTGTVTFAATDDAPDEPLETVVLELGTLPAGNDRGTADEVTIEIEDGDATVVTLSRVDSGAVTEGGTAELRVQLGRALVAGEMIDVPLAIGGASSVTTADWALALKAGAGLNTGVALSDEATATPNVRFSGAGAQTATLILTAVNDGVTESAETITIALGPDGTGANGFDRTTLGTNVGGGADPHATTNIFSISVTDPTHELTLTLASASVLEGSVGSHDIDVTVSKPAGSESVLVYYSLCFAGTATRDENGTKTAAEDYQVISHDGTTVQTAWGSGATAGCVHAGDVAMTAGEGSHTWKIRVFGDTVVEADETVIVTLGRSRVTANALPAGWAVSKTGNPATHTITDSGAAGPEVAVALPVVEGVSRNTAGQLPLSEGEATMGFDVSVEARQPADLTVCLSVTETGASRLAANAKGTGLSITIPAGSLTAVHAVSWTDDEDDGADSLVTVTALAPAHPDCAATGYTVSATAASDDLLIVDDDATTVALTAPDAVMAEALAAQTAEVAVTLGRRLYAGEVIVVPVGLATTTGARLPGQAMADFAVTVAGTGVTATGLTTAEATLTFTGHDTNMVQAATLTFTPVAGRFDADTADETVSVTLATDTRLGSEAGTTVGGKAQRDADDFSADLTISDHPQANLSVSAGGEVTEGGSVTITATRSKANDTGAAILIPVRVKAADTTAQAADYMFAHTNISIATGATAGTRTFTATDGDTDGGDELRETVVIEMHSVPTHTEAGPEGEVEIIIVDNEPTTVTLAGAAGDITEGGAKTFTVSIGRGLVQGEVLPVPLVFGSAAGDATRGTDYTTACPNPLPTGVTCSNLNSGSALVTFTGPATGATATSVTLTLTATADGISEPSGETVDISLGTLDANTGTNLDGGAVGTDSLDEFDITDAAQPVVSITAGAAVTEGTAAAFTVTAAPAPAAGTSITVMLTVADAPSADFVAAGDEGAKQVAVGDTGTAAYSVPTAGGDTETADEPNGPVTVTVATGNGYTPHGTNGAAAVTVADDDATLVTLRRTAGDQFEGQVSTVSVLLDRYLVAGEALTVPLTFSAGAGTATRGTDYTLHGVPHSRVSFQNLNSGSASVTFTGAGSSTVGRDLATLQLTATADRISEPGGETVDMGLGTLDATSGTNLGGGASSLDSAAAFTIRDVPTVSLSVSGGGAAAEGGAALTVTATRSAANASGAALVIPLAVKTTGTTAQAADYSHPATISIANGAAAGSGQFTATQDTDDEPTETVVLALGTLPAGSIPGTNDEVTIEIEDDDPTTVTLARSGATGAISEAGGSAALTVTLGRRLQAGETVTVPLAVSGSGISAEDYTLALTPGATLNRGVTLNTASPHSASQPAVVFAGHATNVVSLASLTLTAADDDIDEGASETAAIGFGSGSRAVSDNLGGGTATSGSVSVVITDNDARGLVLTPSPLAVTEGASATYTVRLASQPTAAVTVTITGTSGTDLTVDTSASPGDQNTLTFSPGAWNSPQTVTVTAGEDPDTTNDTATLTHAGAGGDYGPVTASLTVNTADNDAVLPVVSITAGAAVTEGTAAAFTVTAAPAPAAGTSITVMLTVADAPSADFVAAGDEGAKQVAVGDTGTAAYSVPTAGGDTETADEPNGPVTVTVATGNGYTPHGTNGAAAVTVADDDATLVTLRRTAGDQFEGQVSTVSVLLDRYLVAGEALTVPLTFSAGAGTATRGTDYTLHGVPHSRVSFQNLNSGSASVTFTGAGSSTVGRDLATLQLTATADRISEPGGETVDMGLGTLDATSGTNLGGGASSLDSAAAFTIRDVPTVSLSVSGGGAAAEGGAALTVTATRSAANASGAALVIPLAVKTTGTTAQAADYSHPATISIANGAAAGSGQFTATQDTDDEPTETVVLALGTLPAGSIPGTNDEVTIEIEDDDPTLVSLSRRGAGAVTEGGTVEFAVSLGRALEAGEIIDAPLAVGGTGVTLSDWSLALKPGDGLNTGVALSGQATATPNVRFSGAAAETATLVLTARDDGTAESGGETLTVALGPDGTGANGFDRTTLATNVGGGADPHGTRNTFDVPVNDPANAAPTVANPIPDRTATAGRAFSYQFPAHTFADADPGDTLTYTAAQRDNTALPAWLGFAPRTRTFSGTPAAGDAGTLTVRVTAADSRGGTVFDEFTIVVKIGVPAVTITAGASPVPEGTAATFTVRARPAPAAPLTVRLTVADAPGADFVAAADEGAQTVTVPAAGAATYPVPTVGGPRETTDEPNGPVTVTVQAGSGYTVGPRQAAAVTVADTDATTVTLAGAPGDVLEGGTKLFTVTVSRGLVHGESLPVPLTFAGGATRNTDYTTACPPTPPPGVTCAHLNRGPARVTFTGPATGRTATAVTLTLTAAPDRVPEPGGETVDIGLGPLTATTGTGLGGGAAGTDRLAVFRLTDPAPPVVRLTGGAAVVEGETAVFTLTARPARAVPVTVTLAQTGAYAEPAALGAHTVTLPPAGTATLTVATRDDDVDEADGLITATLGPGDGYVVHDTQARATVAVADNDEPGVLAIADAAGVEGETLAFRVTLDRPRRHAVAVTWETVAGTAEAGTDFTSATGRLTFAPGETVQEIEVATRVDAAREPDETFTVTLSAPTGAILGTRDATGTIRNRVRLSGAWIGRFGRTVAQQALAGITPRLTAPRGPGHQYTVAGRPLAGLLAGPAAADAPGRGPRGPGTPPADPFGAIAVGADDPRRPPGARQPLPTGRALLLGSTFTTTLKPDAHGGSLAFWGRGAHATFAGAAQGRRLSGDVTTALLGTDYARGAWLAGLAVTQSWAHGDAGATAAGGGPPTSTLTAAIPYGAVRVNPRVHVWGAAGYGTGAVTLPTGSPAQAKRTPTLTWHMASLGARGTLPPLFGAHGPALAVVTDALWAKTAGDGTRGHVTRLRLGLEGTWTLAGPTGGALAPSLALGARHDGGNAETGAGLDLGGGLTWSHPTLGLALDVRGRTLLTHRNRAFEDRGVSAGLAFDPSPHTPLGPSVTLRHALGGPATGGVRALLGPETFTPTGGARAPGGRWTSEVAWGVPFFRTPFIARPHLTYGTSAATRELGLGWRLLPARGGPALSVGLEARRRARATAAPAYAVRLEIRTHW